MSLAFNEKLQLQKEASGIKKNLKETLPFAEKLQLQKRWSVIIKTLKGVPVGASDIKPKTKQEANTDDKGRDIAVQASQTATSPDNVLKEPTDSQKDAGNYKKGHISLYGMDIVIENPKGSVRKGKDENGKEWATTMHHHYGDIKGTNGADGDAVDVFINENPLDKEFVFVVDQIRPESREFDEHKVMLGFNNIKEAKEAYFKNYDDNWQGLGAIKALSVEAFKQWVFSGKKDSPLQYQLNSFNAQNTPSLAPINLADYEKLSQLEVKQQAVRLYEMGYSMQDIKDVLAHWLDINFAEEQAA